MRAGSKVLRMAAGLSLAALAGAPAYADQTMGPDGEAATPASALVLNQVEIARLKEGRYNAAFVWWTSSDFMNAVSAGATDAFAGMGVTVVAQTGAGSDSAMGTSSVATATALAQRPNALLAFPTDSLASAQALKPAIAQGVQIVLLVNKPRGFVQGHDYVAIVADDLFQMGKRAADALAVAVGKRGKVGWIYRDTQNYAANERDSAFKTTIETDYRDVKIAAQAGVADPSRAQETARALLLEHPDLAAIGVTSPACAEGVLAALQAMGNTHTKIVALGLSEPMALDMAKGGNVVAIVADKAYELGRSMATAAGYGLLGQPAPPFVVAPALTITKVNLAKGWRDALHRDLPQSVADALK